MILGGVKEVGFHVLVDDIGRGDGKGANFS